MLVERMLRALRLDPSLYDEVEEDRNGNGQAFAVVLIVAACALVGSAAFSLVFAFQMAIGHVGGWLFWSAIAAAVGARFGARARFEDLLRPVAFAQAPGVFHLLALAPSIGWRVGLVVWLWTVLASIVAVRQSLRVGVGPAVLTVVATSAIIAAIDLLTGTTLGAAGLLIDRIFPAR